MLLPWQMLWPYVIVADVIATEEDVKSSFIGSWQMLLPYDMVVDVKNHMNCTFQQLLGRCYLASGRWNSHCRVDVCGRCY